MLTIEMQTNMFRNKCEKQIAELYAVHKKVTENYQVYDLKLCKLNKLQIAILDKVANYVEFSDSIQNMDLCALTVHAGRLDYLLTELRKIFRDECDEKISELYAVHKKVTENYQVYDLKLCKLNKLQIAILDKVADCVDSSDSIQNMDLSALTIHAGRLNYLLTELRKIECIVRFNLQLHNNYINGTMDKFPAYLKEFTKQSKVLFDTFETYSNLDQILPTNASFYSNDIACIKKPSRVRFSIPE